MKNELFIALIAILSWTASTFFTSGVDELIGHYFVNRYHHRAFAYFICTIVFIAIVVILSIEVKH